MVLSYTRKHKTGKLMKPFEKWKHAELQKMFGLQYKPQTGVKNDPQGQLLAAMLVAYHENTPSSPVFGLYVIGRHWFFVVLDGLQYAVSRAYDATETDLWQIGAVLKARKQDIESHF